MHNTKNDLAASTRTKIIELLADQRHTGTLRVLNSDAGARIEIYFQSGRIDFAAAVARRQAGENVVVRGDDIHENRHLAEQIEGSVGPCQRATLTCRGQARAPCRTTSRLDGHHQDLAVTPSMRRQIGRRGGNDEVFHAGTVGPRPHQG